MEHVAPEPVEGGHNDDIDGLEVGEQPVQPGAVALRSRDAGVGVGTDVPPSVALDARERLVLLLAERVPLARLFVCADPRVNRGAGNAVAVLDQELNLLLPGAGRSRCGPLLGWREITGKPVRVTKS